jgi:methylenetetrahydrofolate dehydrogenase (NADP+)/methenyltetrahydrofolate cyclohydrolase
MRLLDAYGAEVEGMEAVVAVPSDLVGRPQAQMLLERDATVTSCHKGTRDLQAMPYCADILVVVVVVVAAAAAAGAAARVRDLITRDHVKPGATDVGIHRTPNALRGGVAFQEVVPIAARITPVPGGVGPMTVAMLLSNRVDAVAL